MRESTGFEDLTLEEVVANFLYTGDNMFGDIICDAQRELYRRTPPPEWAKKFPLPILAKEWHKAQPPARKHQRKRKLVRRSS